MEGENQNSDQPSANQATPTMALLPALSEEPRLGRRKLPPKPKAVLPSNTDKMRLDELKTAIIQLADKNIDSAMHIIRSWNDSGKTRR